MTVVNEVFPKQANELHFAIVNVDHLVQSNMSCELSDINDPKQTLIEGW